MKSSNLSTAMSWRSRRIRFVSLVAAPILVMAFSAAAGATVRCVSASGSLSPAQAKQYACKPPLYTKIGNAVAASSASDTIYVFNGTYPESVTIPSSLSGLSLIGVSWKGNNPVINADGLPNGILDQASGVTIEGLTLENADFEGILVEGAAPSCAAGPPVTCTPGAPQIINVTISYNVVTNNDLALTDEETCPGAPVFEQDDCGEGVHLDGVAFSTVSYNLVNDNSGGILNTDETNTNHDNLISFNNVSNNDEDCGITLPSHPPAGNPANIGFAFGVFHDSIISNLVANNLDAGVGIFAPTPGNASYNHLVAGNRIVGNGNPGVTYHAHAPFTNLSGTTIVNNIIQNNGADPNPNAPATTGDGPANPTGIEIYAVGGAPPIDARIEGNTINNESNDIWVGAPDWDSCSSLSLTAPCFAVSANLNNLTGGNVGVDNTGDPANVIVNATNDYWGCRSGPGTSNCTSAEGNVLTNPFLSSSTFIIGLAFP
jgi:hypothetical protein